MIYDSIHVTCDQCVTVCDIMLTHNPKFKINRNRKQNKKVKSTVFNSDIYSTTKTFLDTISKTIMTAFL